jgi:hypothetical protein
MLSNLGVKLGSRHFFTELGAGYNPGSDLAAGSQAYTRGTARWSTTYGLGWRFLVDYGRLQNLELEATGTTIYPVWDVRGNAPMVNALRLQAGVRLAPHVNLLAGLSYNVAVGQESTDADLSLGGVAQSVIHDGTTTVRMYPGFVAGLQI